MDKILKKIKGCSTREKFLFFSAVGLIAVWLIFKGEVYPQRFVFDEEESAEESLTDADWLKINLPVLACLGQQNDGNSAIKKGASALNIPEAVEVISITQKDNTLFLDVKFPEHAELLEWLLKIEANTTLRVSVLNMNDAMNKADIILSEVGCYDL